MGPRLPPPAGRAWLAAAWWRGYNGLARSLLLSEILLITFNKSSWLLVGSLIKFEKSLLEEIKSKIDKDCSSIFSRRLLSLASSNNANEYLPAEVIEKPLLLLNLLPLLMLKINLKSRSN